ncbi:hypothetical protein GY45DRAFT_1434687 [Cubamyces sp. BRFM 1775]|nr:hypothetical protein GY45DRAFT_1434687 [Cubamyces sp. BRFM 1775]
MKGMAQMLNLYMEPTGIKPLPGEEDDCVLIRRIPDTKFSIRLFPGSFSDREYCMDIVDGTGHPVNRPFEFELLAGPGKTDTPWLTFSGSMKVRSIEEAYGHKREDILPGEEKYILRDGQMCLMTRPGKPNLRFTVPVRKRPVINPVVGENVINIDFPKEIHLAP